jgi:arabinose-5-phosphate isomerase
MGRTPRDVARHVIRCERDALDRLLGAIDEAFDRAVELILATTGTVIVCGMGKSGHVGRKISSTLVSTGTASAFLHPAEGFHGDVGIVTARDVVLAISNSGTNRELNDLVPVVRGMGAKVIAMTASPHSPLAVAADVALCWGEVPEADSMGLVPTASAAVTLALGDALTVAVMERRGFGASQYRLFHPSGAIGAKLTLRVSDLLRGERSNPVVPATATFGEALDVVTRYLLGGVSIVDPAGRLVGILTDGDVRRRFQVASGDVAQVLARPVSESMTKNPTRVRADTLAIDALRQMEEHRPRPIYLLPIVDGEDRAIGLLHVHNLVQAGLKTDRTD